MALNQEKYIYKKKKQELINWRKRRRKMLRFFIIFDALLIAFIYFFLYNKNLLLDKETLSSFHITKKIYIQRKEYIVSLKQRKNFCHIDIYFHSKKQHPKSLIIYYKKNKSSKKMVFTEINALKKGLFVAWKELPVSCKTFQNIDIYAIYTSFL